MGGVYSFADYVGVSLFVRSKVACGLFFEAASCRGSK